LETITPAMARDELSARVEPWPVAEHTSQFLAGYSGLTRQAYGFALRQYASWCQQHQLHLFQARRADIEFFARDLEARGRARATIIQRLCTIAGFYRYAVEEELLDYSPAAHVRRPQLDYESHATAWTATNSARCWLRPGFPCAAIAQDDRCDAGSSGRKVLRPPHGCVRGVRDIDMSILASRRGGPHAKVMVANRTPPNVQTRR
jgi:Phage integrase, N-terminal SAM-like domain